MCCKVFEIPELEKPAHKWCQHCLPRGGGCSIYDKRPEVCRQFFCLWRTTAVLGEEWYPLDSRMVFVSRENGQRIALHVDPQYQNRWRQPPYYAQIKRISYLLAQKLVQLVVNDGTKMILVLPGKEIPLKFDDQVMLYKTARGWDAMVVGAESGKPSA